MKRIYPLSSILVALALALGTVAKADTSDASAPATSSKTATTAKKRPAKTSQSKAVKTSQSKAVKTNQSKAKKKLQTDVSFSGSNVDGRYHSAGDAVAEVDKEKQLNSLIGMRKNFRDRLTAERARLARANSAESKGTTP